MCLPPGRRRTLGSSQSVEGTGGAEGLPFRRRESGRRTSVRWGFQGLRQQGSLPEPCLREFSEAHYDDFEKLRDNSESRLMLFVLFKQCVCFQSVSHHPVEGAQNGLIKRRTKRLSLQPFSGVGDYHRHSLSRREGRGLLLRGACGRPGRAGEELLAAVLVLIPVLAVTGSGSPRPRPWPCRNSPGLGTNQGE